MVKIPISTFIKTLLISSMNCERCKVSKQPKNRYYKLSISTQLFFNFFDL